MAGYGMFGILINPVEVCENQSLTVEKDSGVLLEYCSKIQRRRGWGREHEYYFELFVDY